jgi:hypothetical protein
MAVLVAVNNEVMSLLTLIVCAATQMDMIHL